MRVTDEALLAEISYSGPEDLDTSADLILCVCSLLWRVIHFIVYLILLQRLGFEGPAKRFVTGFGLL